MDNKIDNMLRSVKKYLAEFSDRGIGNNEKRILKAIENVDRKKFVPNDVLDMSYLDTALPTLMGQTISQPSTVGRMLQILELNKGDTVLEIGTGSGWNAALIGHLVGGSGNVLSLERVKNLLKFAKENIKRLGIKNVSIENRDFRDLLLERKFDKIVFTAGILKENEKVIEDLGFERLKVGGILVCPFLEGPLIILKKDLFGKIKKEYTKEHYVFVELVL